MPQSAEQFQARKIGQHEVQHERVEFLRRRLFEPLPTAADPLARVALLAEAPLEGLAEDSVIFDT